MNKINAHTPIHPKLLTQQSSQASARFAMAPHTLTPLTPPGGSPSVSVASGAEPPQVPEWRRALFDRVFGQIQQKLAERRQAGSETDAQISGELAGNELRGCDAVAQWVSESLVPTGAR